MIKFFTKLLNLFKSPPKVIEHDQVKQENEMREYVLAKSKTNVPPPIGLFRVTGNDNKMTSVRSKNKELVPFNLSESDRKLWEEFNRSSN